MSSTPVTPNPETMSYEELRVLADQELAAQQQPDTQQDPPRNEQGRFVAQPPPPADAPLAEDAPDEIVYRREIDLGDGSGKQVFEAASLDDLVDQLAQAQEHASRKIKQLSQERRAAEVPKPPTDDEEWLVSQELLAKPTETFNKMFEKTVGMPVTAFRSKLERVEAFERAQSEEAAARAFVEANPDYVVSAGNSKRMQAYLATFKLEGTQENIQKAFTDLTESGLLEVKSEAVAGTEEAGRSRIVNAGATVQRTTRASSGLSSRGSQTRPPAAQGPTVDEAYKMPMEELEKLARQAWQSQQ